MSTSAATILGKEFAALQKEKWTHIEVKSDFLRDVRT
jgi:hypothetical protein